MSHPLTDAYFTGPCEVFPNNTHRAFCREMESGLRAEIEQLQDKLKIAVNALEWCHNYARPDLIIRDEVTGPALKAIFPSRGCGQENRPGDVGVCRSSESPGVVPAGKDG